MRKILLMTSAVVLFPLSTVAQTTCTATPDCASLGYTQSSCPDNNGVRCPWGDKWFCSSSETEICSKYGFKYTCTGTGYSGGAGTACGGKYTACTCSSGYSWSAGSCVRRCSSPYVWNGSSCVCSYSYEYTCTSGEHVIGGAGTACNNLYSACRCESGYRWVGCTLNGVLRGCLPDDGSIPACDFQYIFPNKVK